ncbi:MAG: DAK2 domain-containing protein [Ruminococcaceae bacterium]|nr:DAK2 domain-containing protein [Oscillospiraceae bacterium]
MPTYHLNGALFADMVKGGTDHLRANKQLVNDLNVFPIPDGDTGDNMALTMEGGDAVVRSLTSTSLSLIAEKLAQGMLLGARGNSGVILSQLFAGIAAGLKGSEQANALTLGQAFQMGVKQAYAAVRTPTEGTILTVAREATDYTVAKTTADTTLEEFFTNFMTEMRASLQRTPELLPILKESGVIDSGGAGLAYVIEGMYKILCGETVEDAAPAQAPAAPLPDLSGFDKDSEMRFGYCTEFLLQLQSSKTDPEGFCADALGSELSALGGESIVCFKTDTVIKVHVHTMHPGEILTHCQQYGEFLTLKIENMTLQHSDTQLKNEAKGAAPRPHKPFGVVAVASGKGIAETFLSLGADVIVEGGQTMNPSAQDFLTAFDAVNADTIFVLPNNGNIVLAAKQAAALYDKADVRVLESKEIGEGYAALTMLDYESGDADRIEQSLNDAMQDVVTGLVTHAVRDTSLNGIAVTKNDYIGLAGKQLLCDAKTKAEAACGLLAALDMSERVVIIAICGKECEAQDMDLLRGYVRAHYPDIELYEIDGEQDIYPFILVIE